jgi:translation initiation factor 2 subunit 2
MVSDYNTLLNSVFEKLPKKKATGERFEPPVAEAFLQGNKTVIRNFEMICQKLRRKSAELSKFLFRELAVPGTVVGAQLILQTKVPARLLNEKLTYYVDQCVMCKECGKPDTHIEYGQPVNTLICEACGATRPIRA